jgi:hypothetical protein
MNRDIRIATRPFYARVALRDAQARSAGIDPPY